MNNFIDSIQGCMLDIETGDTSTREVVELIKKTIENMGNIFIIGNGGSAYVASHLALDLNHSLSSKVRAISFSENVGFITAVTNDIEFLYTFSCAIDNFGSPNDLLIAFSCSGKSPNILEALHVANLIGMDTILFTGNNSHPINLTERVIIYHNDPFVIESIFSILCHFIVTELREWEGYVF